MSTTAMHGGAGKIAAEAEAAPVPRALLILASGMAAAWFSAGSTGVLGHALQHALTWCALAVAIVAACPSERRSISGWAILAGGVLLGLLFSWSMVPAVNVLAVAVVLGAIAIVTPGLTGRIALIAAYGALALGLVRFASDCIPIIWLAGNLKGWMLGQLAGRLVGSSLEIGATFAGLDLLVLVTAIYAGWLLCTSPPRRFRALWAAAAILAAHLAYLAVLANAERILVAMPGVTLPTESDINNVGLWTWANGLRTLIPWNLPLLLLVAYIAVTVVMFRRSTWLPVINVETADQEEMSDKALLADIFFQFGPVLLAVAAPLALVLVQNAPDLAGKIIVACETQGGGGQSHFRRPPLRDQPSVGARARENWDSPQGRYGMLPAFVESLGGRFATSKDLTEQELAAADVVMILDSNQPWPNETIERVWHFVRRGGSLLLAVSPESREEASTSGSNDVLKPTAMRFGEVTASPPDGNEDQSYDALTPPTTARLGVLPSPFGLEPACSIDLHWPARPIVMCRWGLSGDAVLAAEQPLEQGRVFVLGSDAPFRSEWLAESYPAVGHLLLHLAHQSSSPQTWWRQLLGLAALLAMAALLAVRPSAWQVLLASAALSTSLILCNSAVVASGRVLPEGRPRPADRLNNIAYIDASHLESYSGDLRSSQGLGSFVRILMRQGYLPLFAPDLTPQRLQRAGLLVSIAPLRAFSAVEQDAVKRFVADGGTLICMVGAEEARASVPLLAEFGFAVPPSPVAAVETRREPAPLGHFTQRFDQSETRYVQFYAGWPVECTATQFDDLVVWSDGKVDRPIVVGHGQSGGTVVVIGDTHFASNENLEDSEGAISDNTYFWRWLLSRVTPGREPWEPPAKRPSPPSNASPGS